MCLFLAHLRLKPGANSENRLKPAPTQIFNRPCVKAVARFIVLAALCCCFACPAFAQGKAKSAVKTGKGPTMIKGVPSAKAAPAKIAEKKGEHGNLPTVSKTARAARVVKVDPETVARNRLAAAKIDSLVEANYKHFHVEPNPLTTDERFVRRVYLD